jgi:hypothetical protein
MVTVSDQPIYNAIRYRVLPTRMEIITASGMRGEMKRAPLFAAVIDTLLMVTCVGSWILFGWLMFGK